MEDEPGRSKITPLSTDKKPASRVARNVLWVLTLLFLVYILEAMGSSPLSSVRDRDWTGFRAVVIGLVAYFGIRHALYLVARKRRRAALLAAHAETNTDPQAPLQLIRFPSTLGLRIGSTFDVLPGTFAVVVKGSNVLDVLEPGAYCVNRETFPLLAHDSTNIWGGETIEEAALVAFRDGSFEWSFSGTVRGIRNGGTCIESSPMACEVELTVTERKAFATHLLISLTQRIDCEESSTSPGLRRQRLILTFEPAIEALVKRDSRLLEGCFVDWVWMGIVPQDGTLAVAADSETVDLRAREKLNESLTKAGCRCDRAHVTAPIGFTIEPCQGCGVVAEGMRAANFWACAGFLFDLWRVQRFGNYCRPCGSLTMKRFSLLTAALGWWGLLSLPFSLWSLWFNATSLRLLLRGAPYRHRKQTGVGL